jgi:hypothetical protein
VRIGCLEVHRFPIRLSELVPELSKADALSWTSLVMKLFSDVLAESVDIENTARLDLLQSKLRALGNRKGKQTDEDTFDVEDDDEVIVQTPFGRGRTLENRTDRHVNLQGGNDFEVVTTVIALDFGATLFRPATAPMKPPPSEKVNSTPGRDLALSGVPFEINGKSSTDGMTHVLSSLFLISHHETLYFSAE